MVVTDNLDFMVRKGDQCAFAVEVDCDRVFMVDLYEFLAWAVSVDLIGSYSADEEGQEVIVLPVPDDYDQRLATCTVIPLYKWLKKLSLQVFARALAERPEIAYEADPENWQTWN